MAKKKFYAVAAGRSTGIFTDWATAEKQVKGFAGAKFKSFPSEAEAKAWMNDPVYAKNAGPKKGSSSRNEPPAKHPDNAIVIYTDGGAINNPGPGGYGIVICLDGRQHEISGGFRMTTNNRMEMTACIVALKEVAGSGRPIVLYSDSSYLVNGINKGWAKKWRAKGWRKSDGTPALNPDLWGELLDILETENVTFKWVKGHAGNPLNERCDQLAVATSRSEGLPVDHEYEESR